MKKVLLIMTLTFGIFTLCYSQNSTQRLQGPAAKNAKPWQKSKSKKAPVVTQKTTFLKGPKAKNAKPWERTYTVQPIQTLSKSRLQLKGPAAKNLKVWSKPKSLIAKNKPNSEEKKSKSSVEQ